MGAPDDDTQGAGVGDAHLFDTETGDLLQTFSDPTPSLGGDNFGLSVALDGNFVLIGAYSDKGSGVGQAHLFAAGHWDFDPDFRRPHTDERRTGSAGASHLLVTLLSLGRQATTLARTTAAKRILFDATTGTLLSILNDPTPAESNAFGWSVALHKERALVGASSFGIFDGQAHLFDVETGVLLENLRRPDSQWNYSI